MSAALDILKRAQAAGVTLAADGGQLKLKAPKQPEPELIEALKAHKVELLELLSSAASGAEPIRLDGNATTPTIETWVRPAALPLTTHEASARIEAWLAAMDRLTKAYHPAGVRLKTITTEFALGPWSYPCLQCQWSDLALFNFDAGLIPTMSQRALHFRTISEDVIVLVNGRGALEDWRRQHMPDDATVWWEDERCVGRFH